jgi:arylsulfatase A-like enzyme
LDLAPTILHLLDIPIPGDMDGRVLLECFKEDYIRTPAFESVSISETKSDYHYSDEETDEIKKKLEGLGYL